MVEPVYSGSDTGPWGEALALVRGWDPQWAEASVRMSAGPWNSGVLERKFVELVSVALSASCTNLDGSATRRHIRAALDAGATREETLLVLKCASVARSVVIRS
jgi:alkylhydroperoxidase/carboxymuconolactone decarboxylase family protein YurZ